MNNNWYQSETAPFLPNDIQRPPRTAPSDSKGVIMRVSGEYYLDAHRNEIICHQVWSSPSESPVDKIEVKVRILTNVGTGWIVGGGSDEYTTFTQDEARRCWNHSVDNGATRVYKRANASKSSKYEVGKPEYKYTPLNEDEYLAALCKDPKSFKDLVKEDQMWEKFEQEFLKGDSNYALEA